MSKLPHERDKQQAGRPPILESPEQAQEAIKRDQHSLVIQYIAGMPLQSLVMHNRVVDDLELNDCKDLFLEKGDYTTIVRLANGKAYT